MRLPGVINNCIIRKNGDIVIGAGSCTLPEVNKKVETMTGAVLNVNTYVTFYFKKYFYFKI